MLILASRRACRSFARVDVITRASSSALASSSASACASVDEERSSRSSSTSFGNTRSRRAPSLDLWTTSNGARSFASSAVEPERKESRELDGSSGRAQSPASVSSDAPAPEAERTWVDEIVPALAVPYAKLIRLDRPIGTALLAWPCFWSIALAAEVGAPPDARLLGLFGVGSFLLRGAGCTINDLWDRDIDAKVARTRNRPIASGAVSVPMAVAFLGAQLALGLGVLVQLNDYSKILGASSLALVAAYPAMKRVTNWPQAFLGLTFNWGALLGWAAVHGSCDWGAVLPLYASGVAWTLVYDTIYAHQDKHDDAKVGVKSTALHFGADTKKYLSAFALAGTSALCASGAYVGLDYPFYLGVGAAASHLAWQISTVDLNDRDDCAAKFRSNSTYGALVFAGIVAGKVF
ncbi:UbiA prenyltransferase family [Ostreococcus tauri]|uniref:4-hydroxybenzoate polyprenyltransferase, mitochondrial n=1 Tax=Ostreococcus tauri TaxID=70448 RepID=A0A096PAV6_OSTTA|nr:UbiA prenyltransferase family [Ostreococcus tauri]CEG02130.1 UbiA prenyltransferase family [Ostreococcus tauri]|eukprot:XP_003083051.2 UbiA prenyltransferase family [Ostreococcus tauri]